MDITAIARQAAQTMRTQGTQRPLVYVELQGQTTPLVVPLHVFSGMTQQKKRQLFMAGRDTGKGQPGQSIVQLCLVTEVWFSPRNAGEDAPIVRPSKDPARREGLMALSLIVAPKPVQSMQIFEITRTGVGLDLAPVQDVEDVQSGLLAAFLAGFLSAKLPDREYKKFLEEQGREQ